MVAIPTASYRFRIDFSVFCYENFRDDIVAKLTVLILKRGYIHRLSRINISITIGIVRTAYVTLIFGKIPLNVDQHRFILLYIRIEMKFPENFFMVMISRENDICSIES